VVRARSTGASRIWQSIAYWAAMSRRPQADARLAAKLVSLERDVCQPVYLLA
jgi:hypothetical protein